MLCQQQNLPFSALATRPFLFIMAAMGTNLGRQKNRCKKTKRATPSFSGSLTMAGTTMSCEQWLASQPSLQAKPHTEPRAGLPWSEDAAHDDPAVLLQTDTGQCDAETLFMSKFGGSDHLTGRCTRARVVSDRGTGAYRFASGNLLFQYRDLRDQPPPTRPLPAAPDVHHAPSSLLARLKAMCKRKGVGLGRLYRHLARIKQKGAWEGLRARISAVSPVRGTPSAAVRNLATAEKVISPITEFSSRSCRTASLNGLDISHGPPTRPPPASPAGLRRNIAKPGVGPMLRGVRANLSFEDPEYEDQNLRPAVSTTGVVGIVDSAGSAAETDAHR